MSDGHFNTSFLPHGDFASGVRAGRASERTLAVQAFAEMLPQVRPDLTPQQQAELTQQFKASLQAKEK